MRNAAQNGDRKGFPTLLASVTAPFAFWYEGEAENGFIRDLTPLECERLMGMPEGWTAYGSKDDHISDHVQCFALGNAIAPPCAEYIMSGIAEIV